MHSALPEFLYEPYNLFGFYLESKLIVIFVFDNVH